MSRWEKYISGKEGYSAEQVAGEFPFSKYFESAPQPLFTGEKEKDWEIAEGCYRHIKRIFAQLDVSYQWDIPPV